MYQERDPSHIVQTSDFSGFAGLRVIIRQMPKNGTYGSGSRGTSFFTFGYRPKGERGRTVFRFRAETPFEVRLTTFSVVVPPELPFEAIHSDAEGKIASFEIEPRFLANVVQRAGIAPPTWTPVARFRINQRVDQLCSLLVHETGHQAPICPLYFEGLATALVIAVVGQTVTQLLAADNRSVQNEHIQKALAYIETHFRSRLTRSQMAAAAQLSDFHFSRLFSRLVGLGPQTYLRDCRLRYAAELLAASGSECSIAEVAADAGFADQSHFGREFRRAFGQTPNEFRRHRKHK